MSSIQIRTAHNVRLEFALANIGQRIAAFFLDGLMLGAYVLFVIFMFFGVIESETWSLLVLFLAPTIFYSLFFETIFQGQTPGKKVMNIKVVHMEGEELRFSQILTRWLFRIVDFQLLSGLIAILSIAIGERGQRVGDRVANTCVIDLRKKTQTRSNYQRQYADDYVATYPIASSLSYDDVRTIQDVLDNRSVHRFELITTLSGKIEETLGITKDESSEAFLKKILADYYFNEIQTDRLLG